VHTAFIEEPLPCAVQAAGAMLAAQKIGPEQVEEENHPDCHTPPDVGAGIASLGVQDTFW
jgi:hypothetical protein